MNELKILWKARKIATSPEVWHFLDGALRYVKRFVPRSLVEHAYKWEFIPGKGWRVQGLKYEPQLGPTKVDSKFKQSFLTVSTKYSGESRKVRRSLARSLSKGT